MQVSLVAMSLTIIAVKEPDKTSLSQILWYAMKDSAAHYCAVKIVVNDLLN